MNYKSFVTWLLGVGVLVVGGVWLSSSLPAAQSPGRIQDATPATNQATTAATPTVGTPTATPALITVNTPTVVTITAQITAPTLLAGGANLLRLSATSTQSTVLGVMHDDGLNGDAVAGDKIFSLRVTFNETRQSAFDLQVSAAFKGLLRRVASQAAHMAATSPAGLSVNDLPPSSAVIVRGSISSVKYSKDTAGNIVTDLSMLVVKTLKGTLQSTTITIRLPGGILDYIIALPPGSPTFTIGESVVLIADGRDVNNRYTIPDMALGVFHIKPGGATGELAFIDSHYIDMIGLRVLSPEALSFFQQSVSGNVTVAQLYTTLGVSI